MSVQLLDKTRKINKLLHNNSSSKVVFNDICEVLTGILNSDILVISKKGKVLGSSICKGVDEIQELIVDEVGGYIDPVLNERLQKIPRNYYTNRYCRRAVGNSFCIPGKWRV